MATFDTSRLGDDAIRREYGFLEDRVQKITRSILQAYDKPDGIIEFKYTDDREYNASVRLASRQYKIDLHAAIPLLNIILFYGLLSDNRFLPDINSSDSASDFSVPFIIDPADFDRRADWQVGCSAIRAFAAGTLADMCNTFVVLHEFGHVMSGHCEGIQHFEGKDAIAELVSIKGTSIKNIERRRAWEADADIIAAGILAQFVEDLAADSELNPRTNEVFSDPAGFRLENTNAIVVTALFALFCYIEATRRNLNKFSTHPQPQVRSLLVKNILCLQLEERGAFDSDVFHRYLNTRLDEIMTVLEGRNVFDPKGYSAGFRKGVDDELARLKVLQKRHRPDCAQWSWISWGR